MKRILVPVGLALLLGIALPTPSRTTIDQDKDKSGNQAGKPGGSGNQAQKAPGPGGADTVKIEAKLVNVTLTVSDRYGRFVTGLTRDNFEVYDDNVKQKIEHFTDEDAPISLGIIYDVSGSMSNLTSRSVQALRRFFETTHEEDEFFIVAFNDRARLVQDYTSSIDDILNRIIFIKAKGSTALYDAVYAGIEKAKQGRHPKKALLIISDGEENSSRYSAKELSALLEESGVQVYAVGISKLYAGAPTLMQLAGSGSGVTYFPMNEGEMRDIYTRISIMLRHQYVIGFYPSDTSANTKWHNVRVGIKAPRGLGRLSLYYKK